MKLHGPVTDNLRAAIASAGRLRGHPAYPDTITYWEDLLREGRRLLDRGAGSGTNALERLIAELQTELVLRRS